MLTRLEVQGLVLIKHIEVSFSSGFHVITGETGAGKSILIKAIHLLLGGKASADSIGKGFEQASATGSFRIPSSHKCFKVLEKLGVPQIKDGDNLLVRRTITTKGRSYCWINDTPLTISSLRLVGETLIDVFAQHDNQRLLDESSHTRQLDAFIKAKNCYPNYLSAYKQTMTRYSELQDLVLDLRKKLQSQDYTLFRQKQMNELSPSQDEYLELITFCKRAEGDFQKKQHLLKVANILNEGHGGKSLSQALWSSRDMLLQTPGECEKSVKMSSNLEGVATSLDDVSYELEKLVEAISLDEESLEEAQTRLAEYQTFMRKLGLSDIDQLLAEKQNIEKEISYLETATERIAEKLRELIKQSQKLKALGERLSKGRKEAVTSIRKKVIQEFADLGMKAAKLGIEFREQKAIPPNLDLSILGDDFNQTYSQQWQAACDILSKFKEEGQEKVRFLLATNPGEDPKPLSRVASGGEVSRIMLALKRALIAEAETCILVFDEIDTGISGRVADMVGKKLREMANGVQIICISHLAQVASYAHQHLQVNKIVRKNGPAQVDLRTLDEHEKVKEIARLLSGDEVTKLSIANAKSLVERSVSLT
ncbi:MAG: DNA repair protein RecN [Oligoflexales bacterium]|nr:DNA repair protein RecN [Oligoflexales bacterium]